MTDEIINKNYNALDSTVVSNPHTLVLLQITEKPKSKIPFSKEQPLSYDVSVIAYHDGTELKNSSITNEEDVKKLLTTYPNQIFLQKDQQPANMLTESNNPDLKNLYKPLPTPSASASPSTLQKLTDKIPKINIFNQNKVEPTTGGKRKTKRKQFSNKKSARRRS